MAKKKIARDDAQAFEVLDKAEAQLQEYLNLRDLYSLATLASAAYATPSYSWNDPVGFVVTGPGPNGVVG